MLISIFKKLIHWNLKKQIQLSNLWETALYEKKQWKLFNIACQVYLLKDIMPANRYKEERCKKIKKKEKKKPTYVQKINKEWH